MIMENILSFIEIIEDNNSHFDKKIEFSTSHALHKGIKPVDKNLPISINEQEFRYIYNYILSNAECRNVLDIATGTGISSLAASLAFKTLGHGICVSIDSYEEEITQTQPIKSLLRVGYEIKETIAKNLHNYYNTHKHISFYNFVVPVGLDNINEYKGLIDMIILDCPKSDEDFENMIVPLNEFLKKKSTILIHDVHTFTEKSKNLCKKLFKKEYINAIPSQTTFPFGIIQT